MYASVPAVAGGSVANVFAPRLQQQHVSLPIVGDRYVSREFIVQRVTAHVQRVYPIGTAAKTIMSPRMTRSSTGGRRPN